MPYAIHSPTGQPQLYARFCIPLNLGVYEVNFGVLPLDTPTTVAGVASESSLPSTTEEHAALLASTTLPPHIQPFFIPKLLREEGKTVRLYQMRFDEQQKRFRYHVLAQPLREPTAKTVKPQLRISCPSIDKKFDVENVLNFLRYYNTRSDGSYYVATPEVIPDGSGYGPYGAVAPTTERTYDFSILLINT